MQSGIIEVYGSLEQYTVAGAKELKLTVAAPNNESTLVQLARMGTPCMITIRAAQTDIEAAIEGEGV
jgi:hypothetical protein